MHNKKIFLLIYAVLFVFCFYTTSKAESVVVNNPITVSSFQFEDDIIATTGSTKIYFTLDNIKPEQVSLCQITNYNYPIQELDRSYYRWPVKYNYSTQQFEAEFDIGSWHFREGTYNTFLITFRIINGEPVSLQVKSRLVINDSCAAGIHEVYANEWMNRTSTENCSHNYERIRTCNICGQIADRQITASAISDWIITKEPTTRNTGFKVKKCQRCGEVLNQEIIPKLEKGDTLSSSSITYKITGTNTVEYVGAADGDKKNVIIPNTIKQGNVKYKVTSIAANAFKNDTTLKKVTIGKNIKRIGKKAFYGCRNLKKITINSTKIKAKNVGAKAFTKAGSKNYAKVKINVPRGNISIYRNILKGLNKKIRIN